MLSSSDCTVVLIDTCHLYPAQIPIVRLLLNNWASLLLQIAFMAW